MCLFCVCLACECRTVATSADHASAQICTGSTAECKLASKQCVTSSTSRPVHAICRRTGLVSSCLQRNTKHVLHTTDLAPNPHDASDQLHALDSCQEPECCWQLCSSG